MKAPVLVLVLALLSVAMGAQLHGAYTQKIVAQVFDQQVRPVQGANVYINYQLNAISGHINTKPKSTNESGEAELQYTDYEQILDSVDYTYTVYVRYGDQLVSGNFIANPDQAGARIESFFVDSRFVFVSVTDQNGAPLRAMVSVTNRTKPADESGSAYFQLPPGKYTIKAEYNGAVMNKDVDLNQSDASVQLQIGQYSLLVRVMDDNRNPLPANVEVGGRSERTDDNGTALFTGMDNTHPQVVVSAQGASRTYSPDLTTASKLDAVFDLTKPDIKDLHAAVSVSGAATVSLFVEDPGALASGIDTVSMSYEVGGTERQVPAYTVGYNTFEAKIPSQPPGSLVKYSARVADKYGNTATASGTYLIPKKEAVQTPENNTAPPPPWPGKVDAVSAVIYVVVALTVLYGAYYYIRKRKGEPPSDAQPPAGAQMPAASPPTQP